MSETNRWSRTNVRTTGIEINTEIHASIGKIDSEDKSSKKTCTHSYKVLVDYL